jgi:diguanylate cyclase (GGDEF)-like protein
VTRETDPVAFRQSLLRLLKDPPPREEVLLAALAQETRRGTPVYSALLSILCHLDFTEKDARRHWTRILAHRRRLAGKLGRDVGLRVALLDYLVNVSRELKNPKVIEISIYESTERSAVTDGLTGLANHMHFLQAARRELLRSKRYHLPMAVVLVDLDNFKRLNDTYGHQAGDEALVHLARVIKKTLRPTDIVARYGGEEFVCVFSETDLPQAVEVMKRLQRELTKRFFLHNNERVLITFSAGVARREGDENQESLIVRADKAMYQAKLRGKNRVVSAD